MTKASLDVGTQTRTLRSWVVQLRCFFIVIHELFGLSKKLGYAAENSLELPNRLSYLDLLGSKVQSTDRAFVTTASHLYNRDCPVNFSFCLKKAQQNDIVSEITDGDKAFLTEEALLIKYQKGGDTVLPEVAQQLVKLY